MMFLKAFLSLFLVVLIAAGVYIHNLGIFEMQAPKIRFAANIYSNLKQPLNFTISDNLGIESYKIFLISNNQKSLVKTQNLKQPIKELNISFAYPKTRIYNHNEAITIKVVANDTSYWNLFKGNSTSAEKRIMIDRKKPFLQIIAHSYAISKAGAALVIFKASDDHLESVYVKTDSQSEHKFKSLPFYKDNYYIALLAADIRQSKIKSFVYAKDSAGNIAEVYIPFYIKKKRYRKTKLNIGDSFLNNSVASFYLRNPSSDISVDSGTNLQKFQYVNKTVRKQNNDLIYNASQLTNNVDQQQKINDFKIKAFHPLKGSVNVGGFGDFRSYFYQSKQVSQAYHLGTDMASVKKDNIINYNKAKVIYADYNGIYGNTLILSHGLGLSSLYAHASSLLFAQGDVLGDETTTIAKTGETGLVLGDHLHFSMLVQGIFVNPLEWMDARWIQLNIDDIIKEAKKDIDAETES